MNNMRSTRELYACVSDNESPPPQFSLRSLFAFTVFMALAAKGAISLRDNAEPRQPLSTGSTVKYEPFTLEMLIHHRSPPLTQRKTVQQLLSSNIMSSQEAEY